VPPPIFSGEPLTPQPVCIGYGSSYSIRGSGAFNTSKLLGTLNCDLTLQEVTSDVATYSSYEEPFSCNGTGIFFFEGMGSSEIYVDNDGFFNCIDATPLVPLFCAGDGFGVVEGIGSFAVASQNASCRNRNTNTFADNLYINGSVGDTFICQFNYSFELAGTGVIFNMMGEDFQCNNTRQYCEASGNFTFNATGNLFIRMRTGDNIMCTDESSNSLTFGSSAVDNIMYMFTSIDGSVTCRGVGSLTVNGTGIIFSRMSDDRFACNAELVPTTTTAATATVLIVTSTPTMDTTAGIATVITTALTITTISTVSTAPTLAIIPTQTVTVIPMVTTTQTTFATVNPTIIMTTLATTTATSTTTKTTTSVSSTSVTASVTPAETVSSNYSDD